jgi:hypothetical protein
LVNCDSALLAFYKLRKAQYKHLASQRESVETDKGRKLVKGARIPFQIPPNPLPFLEQLKEFFEIHGALTDEEKAVSSPIIG